MYHKFHISNELAEKLESISAQVGAPIEELLNTAARQFISRYEIQHSIENDRRAFLRISVNIPAVVCAEERDGTVRYQSAVIDEISPTGIRLLCRGKKLCGNNVNSASSKSLVQVLFSYRDSEIPIRIQCEVQRVEASDGKVLVGARILRSTSEGQKLFQQLLNDLGLSSTDESSFLN